MKKLRNVKKTFTAKPVIEGAGVRLNRVFGYYEKNITDPFLLLDHFGSDDPDDYIAGFPWHPHRGIETVTYMLGGTVEHEDSLGNKGIIGEGDIQWMTVGSGIIHQEMPLRTKGSLQGFQLWVNLPAEKKMMKPRYRGILARDIPEIIDDSIKVKIIAGSYGDVTGPVKDLEVDVQYLDIKISKNSFKILDTNPGHNVLLYIFEGSADIGKTEKVKSPAGTLLLMGEGDNIEIVTGDKNVRFLFISGKPLNEDIAWNGPIVMNTREELEIAFREYSNGTFLKNG